ncbi:protein DEPP1 [Spea bombifrons]|uniref:protein DEPP1 n=1 Tax=Spea bombifrons TaxID=233779 RepID=UPI002348F959|nr:protein DEPP1 [Spea bombifrons]
MRSQLLISVAHLPTISEDAETNSQRGDGGADMRPSNGLEEYVKSIQTLAQPSSVLSLTTQQGPARSQRRSRQHLRPPRSCDGKVRSPAPDATGLQTNGDPLAWLYRQSGKENADSPIVCHSLGPLGHHKATVASKRQPCGRDQSADIQRAAERRNRPHRLQKRCRLTGTGATRRLSAPQLPVIYEL